MKIETKFNIGERVWVAYSYNGEIEVYSDEIDSMIIENTGKISVYFKNSDALDVYEEDLIAYDDTQGLIDRIRKLDTEIIEEEKDNENNKIW